MKLLWILLFKGCHWDHWWFVMFNWPLGQNRMSCSFCPNTTKHIVLISWFQWSSNSDFRTKHLQEKWFHGLFNSPNILETTIIRISWFFWRAYLGITYIVNTLIRVIYSPFIPFVSLIKLDIYSWEKKIQSKF